VVGRILPFGVFIAWVIGVLAPAVAAGASVSFVDDRPVVRTYEEVVAAGGVKVHVHNDGATAQRITVRVIGLADSGDPAVRNFLNDDPVTTRKSVAPGASAVPAIRLGEGGATNTPLEPSSLEIVAEGESGGLARLELTLTDDPAPAELSPVFAPDLTLTAVNYLPSFLAGLRPALFYLAALAALLALALRAGMLTSERLPREQAVWGVAILAAVIGLVWTAVDRDWKPGPELHAISAQPVDVADGVGAGVVGMASSENGRVARLEVTGELDKQLRPQGLTGAAQYTGVYDLDPTDDSAGAKASIDVRDWWPYAALVLGLGVLLGVWLRNWYQRVRPKAALGIRLSDLLARALRLQDAAAAAGVDFGQQMGGKIAALVARLEELSRDDAGAATKKLDELEAQLGRLVEICDAVAGLATQIEETKGLARQVGLEDFEVSLLADAERLRARAIGGLDLTALDGDELKAKMNALEDMSDLLARVGALYASGMAHRERAVELLRARPRDPRTHEALQTLRNDFDEIMVSALQANSAADLDRVETLDDEKRRLLRMLAPDTYEQAPSTVVFDVDMWPLPKMLDARLRSVGLRMDSLEGISAAQPRPSAALSALALGAGESDPQIRVEDIVAVSAQLSPWPQARATTVQFRYSDGTTRIAPVSQAGTATDYRVLRAAGPMTVSVHSHPDGEPLGSTTVEADSTSRRASRRLALKARDRDVARIAVVLAVGSGLVALYVGEPAWGEPSDYLAAVLWGAVAGEGVKLVVAIADRVWPAG